MIYLDYNASTPMAPHVKEAVKSAWELFGNPSGTHSSSRAAEALVESAREDIALRLGVNPLNVIFTSGSTEALTLAIWGQILGSLDTRKRVLVSAIEHEAVLATARIACEVLRKELVIVPVNRDTLSDQYGQIDLDFVEKHLQDDVALVAIMAANNETGVIQPIDLIARLASEKEIPFLCDSTQAVGKIESFRMDKTPAIFTLSGHKIYGPKGSGALVINPELQNKMVSISPGGGQERGIRGGTLNVPSAVGLSAALSFALTNVEEEMTRQGKLRDTLLTALASRFADTFTVNGGLQRDCLKNTLNVRFHGAPSDATLVSMNRVAASRASACSAGMEESSHVLLAMGLNSREAEESMRFSLGRYTTSAEIETAIEDVSAAVTRVRALN
jgi:cysteine desulfurase